MTGEQIDWRGRPRFDHTVFEQLREHTDNVGEILAVYRQVLPVRKAGLLQALADGDGPEMKRLAHMAKSGSSTLGLLRLASLCETIEKMVAAGAFATQDLARAITEEFDAAGALLSDIAGE
jgi:HPt (histidine-containing phosphotransfer) domain-containing protein